MSTVETARGPADTTPMTRTAVLIDFGGVITTSVLQAFEQFGELLGAAPGLMLDLLSHDTTTRKLLVEHECGRIDADAFDQGFAERLGAHGVMVQPERLSARMQTGLSRDDHIRALEFLRHAFETKQQVDFGWIGIGFVPIEPTNPCVVRSRALQLFQDERGSHVLSYHTSTSARSD